MSNEPFGTRSFGGWIIRSILIWPPIGMLLGGVGISVVAVTFESLTFRECLNGVADCGEAMGTSMAIAFSPIIGIAWGLAAGLIGSLVGGISRSARAYNITMVVASIGAYSPFLADIVRRWIWALTLVSLVVTAATGTAVFLIARRIPPPRRNR